MRILGIDPGLNTTGYGIIDVQEQRISVVEAGIIRGGTESDIAPRLKRLYEGLDDLIRAVRPDAAALEALYSHYDRPTTAILMGHARGVLCLAVAQAGIPMASYSATQIKKILTGHGRASKEQVQLAVTRQLNISQVPDPPDVADALAVAVCHYFLHAKAELT